MTAQPGPARGPDTGSHEVIHLGGHAAVVVPRENPAADLPLTPTPDIRATQGYPGRISPRLTGPLLRPR